MYCTPAFHDRDIIKAVARKNYSAAVKHVMSHHQMRGLIAAQIGQKLRTELKVATRVSSSCILNENDATSLKSFTWEGLRSDLTQHCSQLLHLLELCIPKKKRSEASGALSLIIAMLAKITNQRARFVQTVLSLILLSGHTTNQVHTCMTAFELVYAFLS